MTTPSDLPPNGPKGFRRLFEAIAGVFSRGGGGPILSVAAGGTSVSNAAQRFSVMSARAMKGTPAIKSRQESTKEKLEIFENMLRKHVQEKLQQSFHPENYARMYFIMHCSTNMMTRIMGDTCLLYENPAKRKLLEEEKKITQTEGGVTDETNPEEDKAKRPVEENPPEEEAKEGEEEEDDEATDPASPKAKEKKAAPPFGKKKVAPGEEEPADEMDPANPIATGDPDVDALADVLQLSGEPEETETPFDKLMKAYDWDVLLDHVERLCMICPAVWVRPFVLYDLDDNGESKPDTGRLTYIIYTPECADIVPHPDDPNTAIAWYYWGERLIMEAGREPKRESVLHFFTADHYYLFDTEWALKEEPKPNKLQRLPMVNFQIAKPAKGYYVDGIGDDLYDATIELNVIKTIENSRAKDSGFKQLAIQGDPKMVPADEVMGGPSPVYLGEESTAQVLDMMPALEKFTNMWKERELSLASKHGINAAEYKGESSPQSGFAKKLDMEKVLKESKRRRKFFAKAEQELYALTALELALNPVKGIPALKPDAELQTDFAEPTFEEDPQNQARVDAIELKFNVVSVVDILRRKNQDLSDVDLIKMAHRNKRINDVFMTSDQMKLVDLLATRANVGGSFGKVGAQGGEDGAPPEGGPEDKPQGNPFPPKKGKPPFGGK